jgi:hypothetical protein
LVHGGDLHEQVVLGEVEVRCEELGRVAIGVEGDRETLGLVLPGDAVEIEEEGELPLTVVSECDLVGGEL